MPTRYTTQEKVKWIIPSSKHNLQSNTDSRLLVCLTALQSSEILTIGVLDCVSFVKIRILVLLLHCDNDEPTATKTQAIIVELQTERQLSIAIATPVVVDKIKTRNIALYCSFPCSQIEICNDHTLPRILF